VRYCVKFKKKKDGEKLKRRNIQSQKSETSPFNQLQSQEGKDNFNYSSQSEEQSSQQNPSPSPITTKESETTDDDLDSMLDKEIEIGLKEEVIENDTNESFNKELMETKAQLEKDKQQLLLQINVHQKQMDGEKNPMMKQRLSFKIDAIKEKLEDINKRISEIS